MIDVFPVSDAADPRLADYRDLKEHLLRADSGKFIAESQGVVAKLLSSPLEVQSVLTNEVHLQRLRPHLRPGVPVFLAEQAVLDAVTGFHVHRGCLAVGLRPRAPVIPAHARTLVVLEDLVDVDNVGALVRNAAAFDADAVLLSPRAADPYYRKAIRVSMGCVFSLPIVRLDDWPAALADLGARGFRTVGAVLDDNATPLPRYTWPTRAALLFGAEGPGLSPGAKRACQDLVTIAMARDKADSLNVATAAALFLHARSAAQDPSATDASGPGPKGG